MAEVKKGPSGEEILKEAVEETKRATETTPTKPTRASMIAKPGMPKASPAKPEPGKASVTGRPSGIAGGTTTSRLTGLRTGPQSAKQQELAAKREEVERQRKARQAGAAARPIGACPSHDVACSHRPGLLPHTVNEHIVIPARLARLSPLSCAFSTKQLR